MRPVIVLNVNQVLAAEELLALTEARALEEPEDNG
jgi:hypothetical protein